MKTVLFLINGFGIQQKNCYDIFDNNFMRNLVDLSGRYLYSTLTTKSFDYKEGYSELSSGSNTSISYLNLSKRIEEKEYENNLVLKEIIEKSKTKKLQMFCYLDNMETVEQVSEYIRFISKSINKKIILNIVLRPKDISQYKLIIKCIDKLTLDLSDFCTLGLVMGENKLNSKEIRDYIRIMYTEITEMWHDSIRKFQALENEEIPPNEVRPFLINRGFKLEDDIILFFNYNNINVDAFIKNAPLNPVTRETHTFSYYSLFPTKSVIPIKNIYKNPVSDISIDKGLKEINKNCLILCEKEKVNAINYYCCGYDPIVSDNLSYGVIDNTTPFKKLEEYINCKGYDLLIINYNVDDCKNIKELKTRLNYIDSLLQDLSGMCMLNNYQLLISSLYGINKKLQDDDGVYKDINFSTKVPIILVDKSITKVNYMLGEGNINSLINTCFKLLNNECNTESLIVKKGKLSKLFLKK